MKIALALSTSLLLLTVMAAPALADTPPWEAESDQQDSLKCFSLGVSIGQVDGLSRKLGDLAGPDRGVIILEFIESEYLDPYTSVQYQFGLFFVNNFNLAQVAMGMRWSTVPFPKTFLRPWVSASLTLNFLEDLRVREYDPESGTNEADGIGIGVAAAAGLTMRLGRSVAMEVAAKGDEILTAGWLDNDEFYTDEFRVGSIYLRLLYIFSD